MDGRSPVPQASSRTGKRTFAGQQRKKGKTIVSNNHLPIRAPQTRRFRLLPATRVEFGKFVAAGTAFAALAAMVMLIGSPGRAANESQDEKRMIKIGLEQAPVPLDLSNEEGRSGLLSGRQQRFRTPWTATIAKHRLP
jgi:hypothetical protein